MDDVIVGAIGGGDAAEGRVGDLGVELEVKSFVAVSASVLADVAAPLLPQMLLLLVLLLLQGTSTVVSPSLPQPLLTLTTNPLLLPSLSSSS